MKPLVSSIVHVQVAIPEGGEDKARAFYGGLLGLTEIPKPSELAKRGGCWFELPEGTCGQLHLGVDPDFRPARKAHVAFLTADGAELAERARSQGHEVVQEQADGTEQVYICDSFGNRLEFMGREA
ncbi:VOC family protein [Candidatus Poriferisocius sp.]|uniref:VOC family protein n=1 Tax=Candidatus Poriferisocius sp. TaxID=3101276 RepID=UPI003B521E05